MFARTRTTGVNVLALVLLAGLIPIGAAQDEPHRDGAGVVLICPPSASRTGSCDLQSSQTVIRIEKVFSTQIEVPQPASLYCQASISIEYTQRDQAASVEGTIENADCAASRGEYVIAVTTRDERGELKTHELNQSWQRVDDRPVVFSADYPIGENVDLVRVRALKARCRCIRPAEK